MTRKTYGQTIIDHRAQNLTLDDDVIEYRKSMESSVMEGIQTTVKNAVNHPLYKNKDFYVVLLFKVERIGQAPRTLSFARLSCPTPVYKQSVWKYHCAGGSLEFLWSIPDAILYHHIIKNAPKYLEDKETVDLAKYVLLMESGELLQWIKKQNGEHKTDAVIKLNQEPTCLMN